MRAGIAVRRSLRLSCFDDAVESLVIAGEGLACDLAEGDGLARRFQKIEDQTEKQ